MKAIFAVVMLALALSAVQAIEKDQVLVLVGNTAVQHTHSKYFAMLQGMPPLSLSSTRSRYRASFCPMIATEPDPLYSY
jgi:hypothetical protein